MTEEATTTTPVVRFENRLGGRVRTLHHGPAHQLIVAEEPPLMRVGPCLFMHQGGLVYREVPVLQIVNLGQQPHHLLDDGLVGVMPGHLEGGETGVSRAPSLPMEGGQLTYTCPDCEGNGELIADTEPEPTREVCPRCRGYGLVLWPSLELLVDYAAGRIIELADHLRAAPDGDVEVWGDRRTPFMVRPGGARDLAGARERARAAAETGDHG